MICFQKMTEKESKDRKFYDIESTEKGDQESSSPVSDVCSQQQLSSYIHDNILGASQTFLSPFGRKKVLYCDHTASGQALSFIEDFIVSEVLPVYGNTHTTTSVTSLQTTLFRSVRDPHSVRLGGHVYLLLSTVMIGGEV